MKSRRVTGFTLIEMAIAVALMSLVALAMFASLRFAQRTYEKINTTEAALAELTSTQRVLRTLIESAYPYSRENALTGAPRSMHGRKDEISFSAPAPLGSGAAGFNRYSIVLRRDPVSAAYYVVARHWVDRNGQPPSDAAAIVEEALIADVASIEWSYLAATPPNQALGPAAAAKSQTWLDEWQEHDRLPAAVRVRLTYASKDSRNTSKLRSEIWPELVIAPRITDDANCEFDVVAQSCR